MGKVLLSFFFIVYSKTMLCRPSSRYNMVSYPALFLYILCWCVIVFFQGMDP